MLLETLPGDLSGKRALVVEDGTDRVAFTLGTRGAEVREWRRSIGPWPSPGEVDLVALRLPKESDFFEMALHASASLCHEGAEVWVYGANDEGIRSANRRIDEVFAYVSAEAAKRHSRVWRAIRTHTPVRGSLADWRRVARIPLPTGERDWVSYPGAFAKGGLDPATAALLAALPAITDGARVLDFGCGTGVISAHVLAVCPSAAVDAIDIDALAVAATRENAPAATVHTGESVAQAPAGPYDLILSNPPIHTGKDRSYAVLEALLAEGPKRLAPRGTLMLVAQKQAPVAKMSTRAKLVWEDTRFQVWRLR